MGSDVDDVLAFLRQHADQHFCSACLAFEFKVTFREIDRALAGAGRQVVLREFRGSCAVCGRRALVTGVDAPNDRSPQERVRRFLLDHPGRFFCDACIGRRLELNPGTVESAVWNLRAAWDVRLDEASCSECGQYRRVVGHDDRLTSPP
jgi:hypothetical protein